MIKNLRWGVISDKQMRCQVFIWKISVETYNFKSDLVAPEKLQKRRFFCVGKRRELKKPYLNSAQN